MRRSRADWKVGLFVFVGIVLLAILILSFSKGTSFGRQTYEILLRTSNVGGTKTKAGVAMAGVSVGSVSDIDLAQDGKTAIIRLRIYSRYQIRRDAVFSIEQSGLLGDQYISISPRSDQAPILQPGDEVKAEEPFDLQQIARSASSLVQRFDATAQKLNQTVDRIDRTFLSEQNLFRVSATITNFQRVSERAFSAVEGLDQLVRTNAPFVGSVVTNLSIFSGQLDKVAVELQETIGANRTDVSKAVKNLEASSGLMKDLLSDVQAGKGLAGGLLKDEQLKQEMGTVLGNLVTLSSNLTRYGLLYKPPQSKTNLPTPLYHGKNPRQ